METEGLETFLTVARLGSINKAAEALFLSQSTVTHRLQRLEKELNASLFVRTPQGVETTPEGRRLFPIATSVVEQLQEFRQGEQERTLTVVAGRAFIAYDLPDILASYRGEHPQFTCYVKSALQQDAVNAMLTGGADLALLGTEVHHPELCRIRLPGDPILLIMAPHHPWAAGFPGFDQWRSQGIISYGNTAFPFRQRVDHFLAEQGLYPEVVMELDSIRAVQRMVARNLGVAFLPWRTVREEVETGRLVARDVTGGEFIRPTELVYPRHRAADGPLRAFVGFIGQWYKNQAKRR